MADSASRKNELDVAIKTLAQRRQKLNEDMTRRREELRVMDDEVVKLKNERATAKVSTVCIIYFTSTTVYRMCILFK
jgi:chromosome segregation ATPase